MKHLNDRRKPSVLNVVSVVGIIFSFVLSISSLVGYYSNKAELAEKYNTKLKTDYTKLWNERNKETDERFNRIQEYLIGIQENNVDRLNLLEDRVKTLEKK